MLAFRVNIILFGLLNGKCFVDLKMLACPWFSFLNPLRIKISLLHFSGLREVNTSQLARKLRKNVFLFPSDVYLCRVVCPSFCLCDSCESQDGFTPSWVAEPYLDSNWVYFADSGQMFVSSASICSVSNRFVLCMADLDGKRKQTRAQVEQRYCVIFVLGQQRWSHQQDIFYLSLMPLCCDA